MVLTPMSSSATTISDEGSMSSGPRGDDGSGLSLLQLCSLNSHSGQPSELNLKKKRNKPGNPDPNAEVVALSPRTLMSTNRYACDVCGKGFQREQNLQLHRRGHSLPWKLKRSDVGAVRKKVYVCPEVTCAHHHPSRALGDVTGIKKHFWRKHGEKRWACERCSKKYAVKSDWKAHIKTCGTREYRCDCGTIFSRRDAFASHRAFCEALAKESARIAAAAAASVVDTAYGTPPSQQDRQYPAGCLQLPFSTWEPFPNPSPSSIQTSVLHSNSEGEPFPHIHSLAPGSRPNATLHLPTFSHTAATAGQPVTTCSLSSAFMNNHSGNFSPGAPRSMIGVNNVPSWLRRTDCRLLTRNFLGTASDGEEDLPPPTGNDQGGRLEYCMESAATSPSRGYFCHHAITATTETKPEPSFGRQGLSHQHPSASTSAPRAWWRLCYSEHERSIYEP